MILYQDQFTGTAGTLLETYDSRWVNKRFTQVFLDGAGGIKKGPDINSEDFFQYLFNAFPVKDQQLTFDFIIDLSSSDYRCQVRLVSDFNLVCNEQVGLFVNQDGSGSLSNQGGGFSHSFPIGTFIDGSKHSFDVTYKNDMTTAKIDGATIGVFAPQTISNVTGSFALAEMQGAIGPTISNLKYSDTLGESMAQDGSVGQEVNSL